MLVTLREISEAQASLHSWKDRLPTADELTCQTEQKNGSILSFSCRAGGRVVRANRPELTSLGRYGFHLGVGMAFSEDLYQLSQPRPLALDALRDRAATNKPPYPLCVIAEEEPRLVGLWQDLCNDKPTASELLDLIDKLQGKERCKAKIVQSSWSAQRAIRKLPLSSHRDALERIASSLNQ